MSQDRFRMSITEEGLLIAEPAGIVPPHRLHERETHLEQ